MDLFESDQGCFPELGGFERIEAGDVPSEVLAELHVTWLVPQFSLRFQSPLLFNVHVALVAKLVHFRHIFNQVRIDIVGNNGDTFLQRDIIQAPISHFLE